MKKIYSNQTKFLAFGLGLFLSGTVLLSGCGSGAKADQNANQVAEKSVEVTTAKADKRAVSTYLEATGSLIADDSSEVASQVAGQVLSTPVDVGAFVSQGSVIIQLNTRDAQLKLEQAKASEQQALAALKQAQARLGLSEGGKFDPESVPEVLAAYQNYQAMLDQVRNSEANVENLEAQARLAEDTARRYGNLLKTGDASQLLYNQQRTQAEAARKQVDAAKAGVNSLKSQANASKRQYEVAINTAKQNNQGISSAQANLKSAQTQVAIAEKAVSDNTIRAPFSGFISERKVSIGEYVTTSTSLVTLVRTNPIKLNLQIPEADSSKVRTGMSVSINVAAYPDRQFAGIVTAINPTLVATSRAVIVEAQINNSENLLRPNMFATGRLLQPGGTEGVFVPKTAVSANNNTDSKRIFIIVDGKAKLVVIQTGAEEGNFVQIVSGLEGTETVATSNVNQLFDGVAVNTVGQ